MYFVGVSTSSSHDYLAQDVPRPHSCSYEWSGVALPEPSCAPGGEERDGQSG